MNKFLAFLAAAIIAIVVLWLVVGSRSDEPASPGQEVMTERPLPRDVVSPSLPDEPREIDITEQITAWTLCASQAYEAGRQPDVDYDQQALDASWASCSGQRDAIVNQFSEADRANWNARLDAIQNSIAASAVARATAKRGYGLNPGQPVMVGGFSNAGNEGPLRTIGYLSRLRGPAGERIRYERIGSCCAFKTANVDAGNQGRLDMYRVSYSGLSEAAVVYFNVYDEAQLKPVVGFTLTAQ